MNFVKIEQEQGCVSSSFSPSVNSMLREKYDSFMELTICLDVNYKEFSTGDELAELREMYEDAIAKHNAKMLADDFMDAGFDLYCPTQFACVSEKVNKIDFAVKCSGQMVHVVGDMERKCPTGFYMYPRSSLSKTKLRLANSVGIIDAGYRGNLIGMFDYKERSNLTGGEEDQGWMLVEKGDRLMQICAPGLVPIFVLMVDNVEELGVATMRGEGGFGSTNGVKSPY